MITIFIYIIFGISVIPEQFIPLANKALLNSTIKVSKSLRENTKYPGVYKFGNAQFRLYYVLSSSQTKEIKGYAIEKKYAAIVKRKIFKIDDGFILLDIQNQEFYVMKKVIASDEKINIYEIEPIDMFFVFSEIEFKGKTPLLSYKQNYNWDEKRNRPHLSSIGTFSAGAGTYFRASIHSKVRFHSIKKAEITTDVTLIGKVGVEVLLKKSNFEKYKELQIMDDIDIPIPGFGISFKFLGLSFEFGLFFTFGVILKDLEKCLQVDIDYFKGYQFTAKRYICIKRHGTTDSDWKTEFSSIPSGNIVEGSATDLESNYIKGTIQFNQGIKLKATVAVFETSLDFGFAQPFKIEFGFSPLACPYPYMYGGIELPIMAYYGFSGVKLKVKIFGKRIKYTLIHSHYKYHHLTQLIKTKKYCLFDSKNNNDYIGTEVDGGENDEEELLNETSDKIYSIDAYDLKNRLNTSSLISTYLSLSEHNSTTNTQVQMFSRRATPFEDIINNDDNKFDVSIVALNQSRLTSKVSLNFLYYTGTNLAMKSDDYSFYLKEYTRKDDGFVPIYTYNTKKTEGIGLKLRISLCEHLPINEMYIPELRMGIIDSNFEFGDKLCVIVKDLDENSTDYVDENAIFTTDGTLSQSLNDYGIFKYDDEYFELQLISVTIPSNPDSGTNVHYEICAEWGNDFKKKALLIGNFSNELFQGKNIINESYNPKFRLTKDMRLYIVISYIHNYNIINLRQPIIYNEAQETADKVGSHIIVRTEPKKLISCECKIQRYTPIIRINCSNANSTHRIITNAYTLNSVKPSKYIPQTINFKEGQLYGVFELKKADKNVKSVIIHMPKMQPLCNFSKFSDEYYLIQFDKDALYIPFRRENESADAIIIKNVIQGTFIDEETISFSNEYYTVDFDKTPYALVLVQTISNQYSITGVNGTKKTLIDYGDENYQLLALEYWRDKEILISPSLLIIDENHPIIEKTIPHFPNSNSVIYHVWCERADEILMIDKTSNLTIENNFEKDGLLFKLNVIPGHIIDFIPVCTKNLSKPMCYFKQYFSDPNGYTIFRYPDNNGITILDTNLTDIFDQEDRQGLIEEAIKRDKAFYYMTASGKPIEIVHTYQNKVDLELRIIDVPDKYKKFCLMDKDGFIVPVSREYYTDNYADFMKEFGIDINDLSYDDFDSGTEDSCLYLTYSSLNSTEFNDTGLNDSDYGNIEYSQSFSRNLLSSDSQQFIPEQLKPSSKVSDVAKSVVVQYYKDIKYLIPPEEFNFQIYSSRKIFENDWLNDSEILNYEIAEYFIRTKLRVKSEGNNSIYALFLTYNEFSFNNILNDNEYISSKGNMTIHYLGSTLNYLLPEKYHTVIDLGEINEITLNLIGKGSLEIKSKSHSILIIKGCMNIESNKTIYVSNNIKEVQIENVKIANYAELHVLNSLFEKVNLKIANIFLLAHSKANLTGLEITDTIHIKQTATANFDDSVIVKNSTIIIYMIVYQNDLIPMIKGSLVEPPKEISIHRSTENGPKIGEEYIIFDGQFDCQLWIERLGFNNSLFNTARCSDNNETSAQLLDSVHDNRGFVSFAKQNPIEKEETYWSPELIALIVFGVIAGVLLVIIIVFIFIKIDNLHHKIYPKSIGEVTDEISEQSSEHDEHFSEHFSEHSSEYCRNDSNERISCHSNEHSIEP